MALQSGLARPDPRSYTATALDPFTPAERGSDWFVLDSLDLLAGGRPRIRPSVGLTAGFAWRPMVIAASGTPSNSAALIEQQAFASIGGSILLFDRLRLGIALPLSYNQGTSANQVGDLYPAADAFTVGDLRVGFDLRLFGHYAGPVTGAVGGQVWIPTESGERYLKGGGPLGALHFRVAGDLGPVAYAAQVGFARRGGSDISYAGATLGFELTFGAAAGVRLYRRNLLIGPEIYGRTTLAPGSGFHLFSTPIEVLLGAHYRIAGAFHVSVGVGRRLTNGLGAPDLRGVVGFEWRFGPPLPNERVVIVPEEGHKIGGVDVKSLSGTTLLREPYAGMRLGEDGANRAVQETKVQAQEIITPSQKSMPPYPPDQDDDAIPNVTDACPDRPGLPNKDPALHGCPKLAERIVLLPEADGHIGAVEVDDGKSKTLLDTAYATAEVAEDGRARLVKGDPGDEQRRLAGLARAMPSKDVDSDGDGVIDPIDACPKRSGPAGQEASRNGCPKTVERVVVLPDANGHVGGIEVTAGNTTTVLDKAYASAETGADGATRPLQAAADEVARNFGSALAAQPPGSRILIYFDAEAKPLQDLAGPIAAIVAEVKMRPKSVVEVIGHTDRLGWTSRNVTLGLTRAQLIGDRLVAAGLPKDKLKVSSKGESELAVRTPDEVPEPKNRRVEVIVR